MNKIKYVFIILFAVLWFVSPVSVSASGDVSGGDFLWTPYYAVSSGDVSVSLREQTDGIDPELYASDIVPSSYYTFLTNQLYTYNAVGNYNTYYPWNGVSLYNLVPSHRYEVQIDVTTSFTGTLGGIYDFYFFGGISTEHFSRSVGVYPSGDYVHDGFYFTASSFNETFYYRFSVMASSAFNGTFYARINSFSIRDLDDSAWSLNGSVVPEPDPEPGIENPEELDFFYPYDFGSSSVGYPVFIYESEPYDTDMVHFDLLFNSYVRFLPHSDTKRLFAMVNGLNISWSAVGFSNANYSISVSPYVLISGRKYYIAGKNSLDGFSMSGRGSPFELPYVDGQGVEYTAQIGMDVYVAYARDNESDLIKYVGGSFLFTLNSAILSVCCSSSSPDFNIVTSVNVATSELQNALASGFASSTVAITNSVTNGFNELQNTLQSGFESSTTSSVQNGIAGYEQIEDQLYDSVMDEIGDFDFSSGSLDSVGAGFVAAITFISSMLQEIYLLTDFSTLFNITVVLLFASILLGIHRLWKGGGDK